MAEFVEGLKISSQAINKAKGGGGVAENKYTAQFLRSLNVDHILAFISLLIQI